MKIYAPIYVYNTIRDINVYPRRRGLNLHFKFNKVSPGEAWRLYKYNLNKYLKFKIQQLLNK